MGDFYATDQLDRNVKRPYAHGRGTGAVHAVGVKLVTHTGQRVPQSKPFTLCGAPWPERAAQTSEPVTCKRCLRIITAAPCAAQVQQFRFPYTCEVGGPHLTHRAIGGSVHWRADETATACDGTDRHVLWRNVEENMIFTRHDAPTAVAGHRGPVPVTVFSWFYDGREVASGPDRAAVAFGIVAALKELRAAEDDTGSPYGALAEACRGRRPAVLHVCG